MLRTRDNIFDQVQNPRKTILTSQNNEKAHSHKCRTLEKQFWNVKNTRQHIRPSAEPKKNNSDKLRTRDNYFEQVQNPKKTHSNKWKNTRILVQTSAEL